jgi:hypothetical protein
MLALFSSLKILPDRELIGCEHVGQGRLVFLKNQNIGIGFSAPASDLGRCI